MSTEVAAMPGVTTLDGVPGVPSAPSRSTVLRTAILSAARRLTVEDGWASITMARLADDVGVSRQTVYNETGSKPELAQALVLDELARFLGVVTAAFDSHPHDLFAAVHDAVHDVLALADGNPLLRAVVAGTHGADTDLLPLLTTSSLPLLDTSYAVVHERLAAYTDDAEALATTTDLLVRTTLSHTMQPSTTPEATARSLAAAVTRLLSP
jgi:AcrR family transcriptional regulator